jgi:hypothetical protein
MKDDRSGRYKTATRVLFIYQALLAAGMRGLSIAEIRQRLIDAEMPIGLRQLQRDLKAMTSVLDLNIERTDDLSEAHARGEKYFYYVDRTRHSPFLAVVKNAA